jgi:hypothetical protein
MSEVPQPSNINSDEFNDNFDAIDWSKPYERAPKPATQVGGKRTTSTVSSSRPNVSQNAGVHRDQVERFNKEAVQGVTYTKSGAMESTSYRAREREARRRGLSFG